jgi:hypothetical protein
MAFTFNSQPATAAFGKAKKVGYASDYLENKKAKLAYCDGIPIQNRTVLYPCNKLVRSRSFEGLYLFNQGRLLRDMAIGNRPYFNSGDLEVNLYTVENLANVNVIQGTPPTFLSNDFTQYRIDPCGQLFGNTQCGVGNFVNYLQLNTIDLCNHVTTNTYAPTDLYPSTLPCYPKNLPL